MHNLSALSRAQLRWRADLARRARIRRDAAAYRRNILAVFDLAGADPIGPILDCEPVIDTHGGFFSCIAIGATGRRYFTKCVRTGEREARFWRAWQRGHIRTTGRHFRIVPPVTVLHNGSVSILVFPALEFIERRREQRRDLFSQDLDHAVLAIADFNAAHFDPAEGIVAVSAACDGPPTPSAGRLARFLKIDAERARDLAATLRHVEARWGGVRDDIYRTTHCLSHLDAGSGNVTVHEGVGYIHDFGRAGTAPPGADLHKLLRTQAGDRIGCARRDDIVARYVSVFAAKGIELDANSVRLARDAHFAARYRTVRRRTSRNLEVFEEAIRTSLQLTSAAVSGATARRTPGP